MIRKKCLENISKGIQSENSNIYVHAILLKGRQKRIKEKAVMTLENSFITHHV